MKKLLTITATLEWECDVDDFYESEEIETMKNWSFDDVRNHDYDNIERPLYNLEDVGWNIVKTDCMNIN